MCKFSSASSSRRIPRDLFPLPPLDAIAGLALKPETSKRRGWHVACWSRVEAVRNSLNLCFGGLAAAAAGKESFSHGVSATQRASLEDLVSRVSGDVLPDHDERVTPEAALSMLLGVRPGSYQSGQPCALAPFDNDAVSLPSRAGVCCLEGVLGPNHDYVEGKCCLPIPQLDSGKVASDAGLGHFRLPPTLQVASRFLQSLTGTRCCSRTEQSI